MTESLRDVLADVRSDADHLARLGHEQEAKLLRQVATRVERSALPWLTFLSEVDAALFSSWSPRMLRRRFYELEARGFAYKQGRTRFYCEAILPRRADIRAAREQGMAAARDQGAAA